ncbi:MAG: hypothetical protein BYD32DRAFT_167360 [Podila humilis]|nr:MAG: hypothetical protein BYD32DRAFT_167360 [Podila humilis]
MAPTSYSSHFHTSSLSLSLLRCLLSTILVPFFPSAFSQMFDFIFCMMSKSVLKYSRKVSKTTVIIIRRGPGVQEKGTASTIIIRKQMIMVSMGNSSNYKKRH